jgi:hypothetical protein
MYHAVNDEQVTSGPTGQQFINYINFQDEYGDGDNVKHDLPPEIQARGHICDAPVHAGPLAAQLPAQAAGRRPPPPGRRRRYRSRHRAAY